MMTKRNVLVAVVVLASSIHVSHGQPNATNLGCYFDNLDRALQDLTTCIDGRDICQNDCSEDQPYCESMVGMTIEACSTLCRNKNLQYFALQTGRQCFCGGALSEPRRYGEYTPQDRNCSYPCTGNNTQACGGDYKMQVYEFKAPAETADCFHPGFVPKAYVSEDLTPMIGEKVQYICLSGYKIFGEPELTCQSGGIWTPNVLPSCNYTGEPAESTTAPTQQTTEGSTTAPGPTTASKQSDIQEILPYIIGAAGLLLFLLIVGVLCICCYRIRKRTGGVRQNIRLKPDTDPGVVFLNAGYNVDGDNVDGDEDEVKLSMPDVVHDTSGSNGAANGNQQQRKMSSFADEPPTTTGYHEQQPIYVNANAVQDSPPSPIYAPVNKIGLVAANSATEREPYTPSEYANAASFDPSASGSDGSVSRADKSATGTKDLIGWSRPSSLYQRTEAGHESDDNNTGADENSFFSDPTESSATRL